MTIELKAFRAVDFDWTRQLKSIWRDPPYHVPSLHQRALDDIVDYFNERTRDPEPVNEPLGRVIVGPAGYGKTHLIGELRSRVWQMDGWFVLLDFIGIKDFWSSVALGFLNSLQVRMAAADAEDRHTQYDHLLLKLADLLGIAKELSAIAERLSGQPQLMMGEMVNCFVRTLGRRFPTETAAHRDVMTALVLLIFDDIDYHSVAHAWLQGMKLDPAEVRSLGFRQENSPIKVVQGLSWIMSLVGPTLIAIDQIDAIVTASNSLSRAANAGADQEQQEAQSIVDALAEGLMNLHEQKRRAVTVVSCLEATWKVLQDKTPVAVTARYHAPMNLRAVPSGDVVRSLIESRTRPAYEAVGFRPPYPSWPIAEAALRTAIGFSARQLLRACEEHRQSCIASGKVIELKTFDKIDGQPEPTDPDTGELDKIYETELKAATPAGLMDPEREAELCELLDRTLRILEKHFVLPTNIDSVVQRDPDQKRPSLHGRLSFTFRSEGDREQHYCFRILGHANARAFQSRLKAAMTASGIDTALKFRHMFILRRGDPPGGAVTTALVDQFRRAGGKFVAPADDDLRTFVALAAMTNRQLPNFDAWLRQRRPLFGAKLFQEAGLCPPPFLAPPPSGEPREQDRPSNADRPTPTEPAHASAPHSHGGTAPETGPAIAPQDTAAPRPAPPSPARAQPQALGSERTIPIGRRYAHGTLGDPVTLKASLLPRHVAILAGAGSGKTVLLRRIVEEAALLGIPAIVLDPNNDLSRLGDPWPARPDGWSDDDAAKADAYRTSVEVKIWTPGVASGAPISLNLLPDFAAIGDKQDIETEDERTQAIEMARATLEPYVGASGQRAGLKRGVLADALREFARRGGRTLDDLVGLLAELPEEVSRIGNAQRLAGEIADQLLAAVATNPLLQSQGPSLDPKTLFEGTSGRTRVSVINLAGLVTEDARDSFVNRLQMSLFTFIKRNPSPTGLLYVIDEAQNFAPSGAGTACKASAVSLAAQARKYGLGMIVATQTPKGIDNKIVSNCTTHFYGRMGSTAAVDAIQDMMAAKGGGADDIGKLSRGEFYFSTEGSLRPFKVHTPLCLSWHPANPPTAEEVIQKARSKRL
jgi:DNA helicase HerA-like ATPase